MKKEIWKKIKGFEEYSVSSTGHVKRVIQARNKQKLKEKYLGSFCKGYQAVVLYKEGKKYTFKVHHLVLETFGSSRPEGYECNHINADRADNRIENLEWVTSSENRRHCMKLGRAFLPKGEQAGRAKLKEKDVYKIRELLKTNKYYLHEIGKMFGVKTHAIWAIKKGGTMTENICFWNHWNNKNIGNTLSNKKGEEMNIYDLEIRLEELESKLYEVVCLAKDIEREARHFGGEIGRVVGGQLDSYFISWMNAFIENKHQPGSIASLRNYLTREREERREEDGDR